MTAGQIVDELIYQNYKYNRIRSPEILPSQWAKIYGQATFEMEQRFQQEEIICVN
jgi:hypothetical protein